MKNCPKHKNAKMWYIENGTYQCSHKGCDYKFTVEPIEEKEDKQLSGASYFYVQGCCLDHPGYGLISYGTTEEPKYRCGHKDCNYKIGSNIIGDNVSITASNSFDMIINLPAND